jgi:hypothetical protein
MIEDRGEKNPPYVMQNASSHFLGNYCKIKTEKEGWDGAFVIPK